MKIIEHGKKPDTTKRFTCGHCGCIFEADDNEYTVLVNEQLKIHIFECHCPACRTITRWCPRRKMY